MKKDKEEFKRLKTHVIIVKPTIYGQVEEDKRRAIKRVMAIVDTQVSGVTHGHVRKAVLDAVNDMARSFCITLDRVVEKIEPTLLENQFPQELSGPRRLQELGNSSDME